MRDGPAASIGLAGPSVRRPKMLNPIGHTPPRAAGAIDPVVTIAERAMHPFRWSQIESAGSTPETVRFFGDAAAFGIRSGVSIPMRGGFGRTALLTLASDRPGTDAEVRNVVHAITAVAFVHVHLNRLVRKPHHTAVA